MKIIIEQLPSGYYHIRGAGVCQWAQVKHWPCTRAELEDGNFQGGEEFLDSVMHLSMETDGEIDNHGEKHRFFVRKLKEV